MDAMETDSSAGILSEMDPDRAPGVNCIDPRKERKKRGRHLESDGKKLGRWKAIIGFRSLLQAP